MSKTPSRDWESVVLDLRKSASDLRESHPDAALMRCRKATEAIILSIYEELHGELPKKYYPYEQMMAKLRHHNTIPTMIRLALNTAQQWGNYGSHYQHEENPTPGHVDFALGPLDNLIQWRFNPKIEQVESEYKDDFSSEIKDETPSSDLSNLDGLDWILDARNGRRGYRCMDCGFTAKNWSALSAHKHETGHESAECTVCGEYIVNGSAEAISKHKAKTGHSTELIGNPPPHFHEHSIRYLRKFLIELVTNAYELETNISESWVNLAQIGARVKLLEPEFKIEKWGTKKWSKIIEVGLSDVFEIRKFKIRHSGKPLSKPTTFEIRPIHITTN